MDKESDNNSLEFLVLIKQWKQQQQQKRRLRFWSCSQALRWKTQGGLCSYSSNKSQMWCSHCQKLCHFHQLTVCNWLLAKLTSLLPYWLLKQVTCWAFWTQPLAALYAESEGTPSAGLSPAEVGQFTALRLFFEAVKNAFISCESGLNWP